jgi:hypothetical protein
MLPSGGNQQGRFKEAIMQKFSEHGQNSREKFICNQMLLRAVIPKEASIRLNGNWTK